MSEMPDFIDEDYVDGQILGLCGSLVEIRSVASESSIGSTTVHLAHFSVKEFFIGRMSMDVSIIAANEHLRQSNEANQSNMLAMMCLRYVGFPSAWKSACDGASQATMSFVHCAAGSSEWNEQYRAWETWYDTNNNTSEERGSETGSTPPNPLYNASLLRLRVTVELLLKEQKCNINQTSSSGITVLSVSRSGGNLQIVTMLLKEGANITIASGKGRTPLDAASAKGYMKVVQLLLEKGADVMAVEEDGWTALYVACEKGHIEVVRLLLEKGADVVAIIKNGWMALHVGQNEELNYGRMDQFIYNGHALILSQ